MNNIIDYVPTQSILFLFWFSVQLIDCAFHFQFRAG